MPFSQPALQAIHDFSKGTPRVINTICDNALFESFTKRSKIVEVEQIQLVASDLGMVMASIPRNSPGVAKPADEKVDFAEIDRYLEGLK
jgi:hypothetical protein